MVLFKDNTIFLSCLRIDFICNDLIDTITNKACIYDFNVL